MLPFNIDSTFLTERHSKRYSVFLCFDCGWDSPVPPRPGNMIANSTADLPTPLAAGVEGSGFSFNLSLICILFVMKDGDDLLVFHPINLFVVFCLVRHKSSSIFALVKVGFTWGQGTLDNTLISPSYQLSKLQLPGTTVGSYTSAYQTYRCHPSLGPCSVTWSSAKLDKHWQLKRGISMTDGYWLSNMVICFCAAAQLISHKETQETLLDCYSERLSVSLHRIPNLIHLLFSLSGFLSSEYISHFQ